MDGARRHITARKLREHIDVLQRRVDFLDARITDGEARGIDRSYDKQERSALTTAVQLMEAQIGEVYA